MGVMSANLKFDGNFPVLKNSLTSNLKKSVEHSDDVFKNFGSILFKVAGFLMLITYNSFSRSDYVTSL